MIWLVVPTAWEGAPGAGQWKDLQGIRLVLARLATEWREFRFDGENIGELADLIGSADATAIWYYSFWPEAMEELKRRCPQVRIVLRTVNAEALQHWTRAQKDWRKWRGLPRDIYGFLRLLMRDRRCCRVADVLAGISPWDDRHYWARLARRIRQVSAPYFCPWPALQPDVPLQPWAQRDTDALCLAGTRDSIGRGHVAGFMALARQPAWAGRRMTASAGLLAAPPDDWPAQVTALGRVAEPWPLLGAAKAVAVLSPLGSGCKTTVTDGLAAGCHVLVHSRQHERLPPHERELAIPIDPASATDAARALVCVAQPPPDEAGEIQQAQFERAVTAWREVLAS